MAPAHTIAAVGIHIVVSGTHCGIPSSPASVRSGWWKAACRSHHTAPALLDASSSACRQTRHSSRHAGIAAARGVNAWPSEDLCTAFLGDHPVLYNRLLVHAPATLTLANVNQPTCIYRCSSCGRTRPTYNVFVPLVAQCLCTRGLHVRTCSW